MKAIRACLLAVFVASAVPASAAPIAIGEFAFNFDPFFGEFFSVANNLAPDHPLVGVVSSAALVVNATVVPIDFTLTELAALSMFDFDLDGVLSPGESAQTFADFYLGAVQFARLDFGSLVGFSASVLDLSDPTALIQPATIFYDPEVARVPEPGTLLLLGSGLALAALRGRRRHA
jgi:hypothetical protein